MILPLLYATAIINFFMGVIILLRGGGGIKRLNFLFGGGALGVAFWALSIAGFYSDFIVDILRMNLAIWAHFFALLFAIIFLFFTYNFPRKIATHYLFYIVPGLLAIAALFFLFTGDVIETINLTAYTPARFYLLYASILVGFFTAALYLLWRQWRITEEEAEKQRVKYIILGTLFSIIPAAVADLGLPFLGVYDYLWAGPVFTLILIGSLFLAIFRYHLFDIRFILTELLLIIIIFLLLINLFLIETILELIFNLFIVFAVLFWGFLLARGIYHEIEAKENTEEVANRLTKINKELRRMEEQKSEFISIASHQVRTPLTAIKGYTSMLAEGSFGELPKGARAVVDKMFNASQKLAGFVQDLLTASRIEQGRIEYNFAKVDVEEAIDATLEQIGTEIEEKGLGLTFQNNENGPYLVYADQEKIQQVFNNIIDNAVKFTDRGFIRVYVSYDNGSDVYRISISDTGAGMDKDTIREHFEKAAGESVEEVPVSGLGIYIAQRIIRAHHGKIWAESPGLGSGSTVFVELPPFGRINEKLDAEHATEVEEGNESKDSENLKRREDRSNDADSES